MTAQRVFYALIAGLLLAIIGGGFAYNSLRQQLVAQSENIRTKKAQLAASNDALKLTLRANSQLEQLTDVSAIISNILPNSKAQSDIVADVTALANNSGVRLNSINFNSSDISQEGATSQTVESEYSGLRKFPVTVTVRANYNQLLEFTREVESNQRKITVESLTISPTEDGQFDANLVINFYVRTS